MTWLTKIFYCNNMENELKSNHNKSKFCMDAGFLNFVDVGQYFHDERHSRSYTI